MRKKPESKRTRVPEADSGYAQVIASHGEKSTAAVKLLQETISANALFSDHSTNFFESLATSLKGWSDEEVASVVNALVSFLPSKGINEGIISSLQRWIKAHPNDSEKVVHCLSVNPPNEISILSLKSLAGSQKLVFLANWQNQQRQVVLKKLLDQNLISREMQSHPLTIAHPNIIETHFLQNDEREFFLVERYLPKVLHDGWSANGVHEAANLLRDMANALKYVHEKQLVHGDVKPDNIAVDDGDYILLDFGICRKQAEFENAGATGSLRTRAPELFSEYGKHSFASDIWALGATVFHTLTGRFPLFNMNEKIPRVSDLTERNETVKAIEKRVNEQWSEFVNLADIPEPLAGVLGAMLDLDPSRRPYAADLVKQAEAELAAFLRPDHGPSRFSPGEELDQLVKFLPDMRILKLMPIRQRDALLKRLEILEGSKDFISASQRQGLSTIKKNLFEVWQEKA